MSESAVESKLQDPHSRQVELVAERIHIRRDRSQILGDERHSPEFFLHALEKSPRLDPVPTARICAFAAPTGTCQAATKPRK